MLSFDTREDASKYNMCTTNARIKMLYRLAKSKFGTEISMNIGQLHVEVLFIELGRFSTVYHFSYFLILVPVIFTIKLYSFLRILYLF